MPNREYEKGARAERELMAHAEQCGATVYRGSGSHGAYDVAVTTPNGIRYLVNIKCNRWPRPVERDRLLALSTAADRPVLAMKVDRKGWVYRDITDWGGLGDAYDVAPWQ